MSTSPSQAKTHDKFGLEHATAGGVSLLTLHGTLDHAFEGRKIAESVHTKKLVVNMRDVRRFASWGMSEWMDFLRINATRDLYLVECSTYAVSQINLVTGLLGHAKLVSFYASYRCGSCSEEHETLFLIPRDRGAIRDLPGSQHECTTCGGRARLEEYPAAFFDTIAERPSFDIDDEVLAFLRTHLKYALIPDETRFRAYRRVRGAYTYIRLSGSIALLPPDVLAAASASTTVIDLKGVVFDPADVSNWRAYVRAAMTNLKSLQLLDCPVGFLESAVAAEDFRDKLKVRTYAIAYECLRCEKTVSRMVDVAANLEQLAAGIAPTAHCSICTSLLIASMTPEQITRMRSLPARDRDPALDALLLKVRGEPSEKLENCLIALPAKLQKSAAGGGRALYVAATLTMLVILGLAVVAFFLWRDREKPPAVVTTATAVVPEPSKPAFERPDWVMSDVPSSAYCHDMINRLMCIGVSSYRTSRDDALAEANDTALEELVSSVGLKISDPFFRANIIGGYSDVRAKAISALQAADLDRTSAAYTAADDVLGKARKRVVEVLRVSGGAAAPAQRSDWYWEQYTAKAGGTEFLVFVRYDVTLDAVKALVEKYSASTAVMGSTAMTAFPALAWQDADFTGGAMFTKVRGALAEAGLAPGALVVALGDQRVADVIGLLRRLDEWKRTTGDLELTVRAANAPARVVEIRRARVR